MHGVVVVEPLNSKPFEDVCESSFFFFHNQFDGASPSVPAGSVLSTVFKA